MKRKDFKELMKIFSEESITRAFTDCWPGTVHIIYNKKNFLKFKEYDYSKDKFVFNDSDITTILSWLQKKKIKFHILHIIRTWEENEEK